MNTLVVMRHGQAEAGADIDANRALTPSGREAVQRNTIRLLEEPALRTGWSISAPKIYHSPFLRTTQTAEIVAATLAAELSLSQQLQPKAADALLGDSRPAAVVDWLQTLEEETVVLVSHQPLVSLLLNWLIEGSERSAGGYSMAPASLALMEPVAGFTDRGCCQILAHLHAR